jgi:hypothetical protein
MTDERRHFNRVAFNTTATFYADKRKVECQIIDVSIQGVLLKLFENTDVEVGSDYQLEIPLGDRDEIISMDLELMHQDMNTLGLMCTYIDLESITHLRRLVELNLGDSELLERNFGALLNDNS